MIRHSFFLMLTVFIASGCAMRIDQKDSPAEMAQSKDSVVTWQAPDSLDLPDGEDGRLIAYGRDLIANTSYYLGPQGIISHNSNGMNCQNCHLKAGTKIYGNNYSAVSSTYPKFRARSGTIETIEKRVNDCIERSLNGTPIPNESKEMRAIVAYMHWVGKNVSRGQTPPGAGLAELKLPDVAADPAKGKIVYEKTCKTCHGPGGRGTRSNDGKSWRYPPLAGDSSYNTGAGIFRISRFAAFVKANMPYGTTHLKPTLSDEEAWNVAAYVNSLPRPFKEFGADWPDISKKPFDHPFGPFADRFPTHQHKFGPFGPIKGFTSKK